MCAKAEQKEFGQGIADQETDFPQWYIDVVTKAELAEDAPVRGCMVVRPYGYALWENCQANLDRRFKDTGVVNAAFPLLIPQSFLLKEAEHVEGFAPEVAWVTHGGGEELAEPLAVRPTSEAIIGPIYSRWIQSYRDLPLLINQWCSVFRWEKRPRLFLRTAEFWWQEGHTVHANHDDCEERARLMLDVYRAFLEEELAIPVVPGQKSEGQKFPGALRTYTVEAMMQDGRALQSGTSHNLGDHFARAFDIMFLNEQNERVHGWTTSWGMSTRVIGALIMVHGDKKGLVLPPRIAPHQVVVLPLWRKDEEKAGVMAAVDRVVGTLKGAGVRVKVDSDDSKTVGWKHNEWELRGVPLRMAIGPRDVENGTVELARRDKPGKEFKEYPSIDSLAECVPQLLAEIQQNLYQRALEFRVRNTRHVADMEELAQAIEERQFADAFWCGMSECENYIKEAVKATNRCMPLDQPGDSGPCVVCAMGSKVHAIFARAY
ncbi:MAG TPA: proline--tRNA ligase [Chloroflexia bacterium]|nr:proline--tRNA ligase [Chloroflexia bacterium]